MMPVIKLVRPTPQPGARERTLAAIERFKKADAELKRVAAEKGITIPEMMC